MSEAIATDRADRAPRDFAWEWQLDAACAGMDVSQFYGPDNERGMAVARRERQAKAICARCPVIAECLKQALDTNEPYGVWGGMTADERACTPRGRKA